MAPATKTKPQRQGKQASKPQVLETLRDLGNETAASGRDAAFEVGRDFFRQLVGLSEQKISGNLVPGETIQMEEVLTGVAQERKQLRAQLAQERRMRAQEQQLSQKKQEELRVQLAAVTTEVTQLAKTTQGLSREVQIATMSAPIEPGAYHVIFFEKLLTFIRSFRKKIENASEWLSMYNARSRKRAHSFWGQVGVSGAKRLLSAEDYLQRAAA